MPPSRPPWWPPERAAIDLRPRPLSVAPWNADLSEDPSGASLPDLFAQAVELDAEGRLQLIERARGIDAGLAQELERLLEEAVRHSPLLDRSPWLGLHDIPDAEPLPETIAGFRVLGELGRGGMGRVLLVEEATADFSRRVALKIVERPGDEEAIRRFREEIRILASLDHPGIARFFSGGRAADGTWYIALEVVEGEDLLTWSAQRALDTRQRVDLFLEILEPVRYAHARGVVHRDLKPSHLLIDREGRPRLLDFGISKLVDPESLRSASTTATLARALTPAYASPEQFRGAPVTPASDVFSLGVVLYELLAGRRPFAGAGTMAADLERAVLESDPQTPSAAAGERSETQGARRPSIARDLDAICLKALRKEPAERYADAGELAADLDRHRRALPVLARRGSTRYRLTRFLRRRRVSLAAAAGTVIVVLALVLAVLARHEAESLRPTSPPRPEPFSFHRAEQTPLSTLEAAFAGAPADVESGATLALALDGHGRGPEARLLMARLRQIPGHAEDPLVDYVDATLAMNAGEPQRALVLFTRAKETALATGRGDLVGQIRASRGRLLSTMGERGEALAEMRVARGEIEQAGDDDSLWRVLNDLAIERLQAGDLDAGRALLEESIAAARRAGVVAQIPLENLGMVSLQMGRPDAAEPKLREAVDSFRAQGDTRRLGESLEFLAEAVHDLGRQREATELVAESIAKLESAQADALLVNSRFLGGQLAWESAELAAVEEAADALEREALRTGDKRGASFSSFLRGRLAAARGDLAGSRASFGLARRLLVENGDLDQAADQDLAHTRLELQAGALDVAKSLLDGAFERLEPGATALGSAFGAEMLRARIDVRQGDLAAARRRIEARGAAAETSPSIGKRLDALVAHAELAIAERDQVAAVKLLDTALATARGAGRTLEALEIRLARSQLGSAADSEELAAVARDATALGLTALAEAARRGGDSPRR